MTRGVGDVCADDTFAPVRHDHVAWVGGSFTAVASRVADAAGPSDLVVVAGTLDRDDEDGRRLLREGFATGRLMLLNPVEAYRPLSGDDDTAALRAQLAKFDAIVDTALADGYRTVRIVADDTAMVADPSPEARERWLRWESLADRWQATRPVVGVCWFDPARVPAAVLQAVSHRHPRSVDRPVPWRLYFDATAGPEPRVTLTGEVDRDDAEVLGTALAEIWADAEGDVDLDVAAVGYLHHRALAAVAGAVGPRQRVRLHHPVGAVRTMLRVAPERRLAPTG